MKYQKKNGWSKKSLDCCPISNKCNMKRADRRYETRGHGKKTTVLFNMEGLCEDLL